MELEGVSLLALVEMSERFDESRLSPGGNFLDMFQRWAARELRSRCRRTAVQLRNGGTFRTMSDAAARRMQVQGLLVTKDEDGMFDCVLAAWEIVPDFGEEELEPEPIACRYEPKLIMTNSAKTKKASD